MNAKTKEAIDTMRGFEEAANRQDMQAKAIRSAVIRESLDALAELGIDAVDIEPLYTNFLRSKE